MVMCLTRSVTSTLWICTRTAVPLEPRAQQVRQGLGVDRVGLHPGGGDRAGPERVREVQVIAGFLEQLREPLPAVGRLQRHVRAIGIAEQLQERGPVVDDPPGELKLAVLVDY